MTKFEKALIMAWLSKFGDGKDFDIGKISVRDREVTGAGFYTNLIDNNTEWGSKIFESEGKAAVSFDVGKDGESGGAVIFFEGKSMKFLEVFSYGSFHIDYDAKHFKILT